MLSTITNKLLEEPVEYAVLFILLTVLLTIAIEQVVHLVKIHKEYRLALIELATKYKPSTAIITPVTQTNTPVTLLDYFHKEVQENDWNGEMITTLQNTILKPPVSRQLHCQEDTVQYVKNGRGTVKVISIYHNGYLYKKPNEIIFKKGFFIKIGSISYFLLDK